MHRVITTFLPDVPPHRIFKDLVAGIVSVELPMVAKIEVLGKDLPPVVLFQEAACKELGIIKEDAKALSEKFAQR
eukprot:12399349-Karenia_brevis.AAC.1